MFLTPEQVKKIRLNGSRKFELAEGIEITITKLTGAAATVATDLRDKHVKGEVPQSAFLKHIIHSSCMTASGEALTESDTELLFEAVDFIKFQKLVDEIFVISGLKSQVIVVEGDDAGKASAS